MPYIEDEMKMTMHIDNALLRRVMKYLQVENKTLAVNLALGEVERKAKLLAMGKKGLGLTPRQLRKVFDPKYDLESMRALEKPVASYAKARARR